jgi:hypothetical protein
MSETDRLRRLEELQAQAAEGLGLPIEHEKVQALASLRLAHESVVERLVHGGGGDHAATTLLNLSEAISRLSPDAPPQAITLEIVHNVGICPQCGYRQADHFPLPKPAGPPPTIDGEAIETTDADFSPGGALPPPAVQAKPGPKPIRDKDGYVARQPHDGHRPPPLDYGVVFGGGGSGPPLRGGLFGTVDPSWK